MSIKGPEAHTRILFKNGKHSKFVDLAFLLRACDPGRKVSGFTLIHSHTQHKSVLCRYPTRLQLPMTFDNVFWETLNPKPLNPKP